MGDIAAYLGVEHVETVHKYNYDATRNRKAGTPQRGDLPERDGMMFGRPVWRPATIINWQKHERPGKGAGGGRPRKTPGEPSGPRRTAAAVTAHLQALGTDPAYAEMVSRDLSQPAGTGHVH